MSAETAAVVPPAAQPRTPLWLDVALAVLFGLFFAYDVWEVVGSIVQLTGLGLAFSAIGWVLLVVALLAPVVSFVGAFADLSAGSCWFLNISCFALVEVIT